MTTLDDFLRGYITCALWATNADHLDPEGTGSAGAMDDHYGPDDLAPAGLEELREECAGFLESHESELERYGELRTYNSADGTVWEHAGHDFFLSRNGHGTGFFDRGRDPVFNALQDAARIYGTHEPYAGDDGRVYWHN